MARLTAAFITGASSGMGEALAKRLAKEGLKVAIAARREEELDRVAGEIRSAGGQVWSYVLDVTDPAAVKAVADRADEDLGGIDLVIANAGVARGRWSGKMEWRHVENVLAVNVVGATATITALLPAMVRRGRGHVVGISSIAQYRGLPKFAAYSGSKAYLSHFLEAVRVDLHTTPISVTDIRAGYVKTGMTGDARPPFLVPADDAARRIWKAIRGQRKVLTFPLPMAIYLRFLSALPNALYDRVSRWVQV